MRLHKKADPYLFLALPLIVYLSVVSIPIFFSVYYSFMDWNGIGDMRFIGLTNYIKMFSDANLRICLTNTLMYSAINAVFQVGFGMVMAILAERLGKCSNFVRVLLFSPVIISSMAMSQTFKKLLAISPDGVVNAVFELLGIEKIAFLSDMNVTLFVVAFVEAYKFSGLYLVIFYSAFMSIDKEVIEASVIDGASGLQRYIYIKFPMIKGLIISSIVLVVNGTLKAFEVPFILTNGGPGYTSELLASYMYKTAFNSMDYGYGSALSILIVVVCVIMVGFINKITAVKD